MPRSRPFDDPSELVGLLYEAAFDPSLWRVFVERIARANRAASTISHVDYRAPDPRHTLTVDFGLAPEYKRLYAERYCALNPWLREEVKPRQGDVVVSQQLMPDRDVVRTEFYNDFLRAQDLHHLLVAIPMAQGSRLTSVTQIRSRRLGPFEAGERRLIGGLLPHLRRAIEIRRRLEALDEARRLSEEVLDRLATGVVLADARGQVLRANRVAAAILADEDGLALGPRGITAHRHDETTRLAEAIRRPLATSGRNGERAAGTMRVSRPSGRTPYTIVVAPLPARASGVDGERAAVAIFIDDPERVTHVPDELLRALYGLSPAEARVAAALAGGKTLKEIADQLHISIHTVRTHMKRIFARTGTSRQSQLALLLLRGPASFRIG